MLSFAHHPEYLDVAVPDPSFFGWPEMRVNPHWHLAASAQASTPWHNRTLRMHWRGGMGRSGKVREALVECATKSTLRKELDIAPRTSNNWAHPMESGHHKLALFVQGEGYTSNKQRVLATRSAPVFAELTEHDTFFGRFLREDTHYKRVRVKPGPCGTFNTACVRCKDLDSTVRWARDDDDAAASMGRRARAFSDLVLSRKMLRSYLLTLLREVSRLQIHNLTDVIRRVNKSRPPITNRTVGEVMGEACNGDTHWMKAGNKSTACKQGVGLVQWWLNLRPHAFAGKLTPPCNRTLCDRCCRVGTLGNPDGTR